MKQKLTDREHFVQGQINAILTIITGLANGMERDEFQDLVEPILVAAHTRLLNVATPEAHLRGFDSVVASFHDHLSDSDSSARDND